MKLHCILIAIIISLVCATAAQSASAWDTFVSSLSADERKVLSQIVRTRKLEKNTVPFPYTPDGHVPKSVKCKRTNKGQCERGTVEVEEWMVEALRFQRELQMNLPINQIRFPGTHNSHIDYSDGYGLLQAELTKLIQDVDSHQIVEMANHWLTVTDQLRMGVRQIELDVHYFAGALRICHAGGIHIPTLEKVIVLLEKAFNRTIHWDPESIGCFRAHYPTLTEAIKEIHDWMVLPENAREFVIVYFDDQMDLQQWHFVGNISESIDSSIKNLTYTLDMKPADRWPTGLEMIQSGKRILFCSRQNYESNVRRPYIFLRDDLWNEFGPKRFVPYPECLPKTQNSSVPMVRITCDALWIGWFFKSAEILTAKDLQEMNFCDNVNIVSIDLIVPEIAEGYVWSWEKGQVAKMNTCTLINSSSGKWQIAESCEAEYYHACSGNGGKTWQLSVNKGPSNKPTCPQGTEYWMPRTGQENRVLMDVVKGEPLVWINNNLQI